jgi:hypothetical protein
MQALKILVVVMGVMIVAGVATLGVVIARRVSAPTVAASGAPSGVSSGPAVEAVLDEPAGTRIVAISAAPDHTVLQLQGGGPDRLVSIDLRSGRVLGRTRLSQ